MQQCLSVMYDGISGVELYIRCATGCTDTLRQSPNVTQLIAK